MDLWQELELSARAYCAVAAAGIGLAVAATCAAPHLWRRLLPLPRLRPGRWGGAEVLVAVVSIQLVHLAVVSCLYACIAISSFPADVAQDRAAIEIQLTRLLILSSPLSVALTLAIVITLLFAVSRTRPHQLGLTWARWPANAVFGVLTFLALTPVTLGVYLLAMLVLGPEEHPFEKLLKQGFAPWEWPFLVFMTVIGAPLVEELVFRGVLQGWLRRAPSTGHATFIAAVLLATCLFLGFSGTDADPVKTFAPLVFSGLWAGGYGVGLLRAQRAGLGQAERDWAHARLAIYGSAMLFAIVHGWPQSIPLFLLALGLGWLAYRTQSLVGCMVCHALFNAVACLVLYWGVR